MDRLRQLDRWLTDVGDPEWSWMAKRLAPNDTLLTGGHQAGPYIPKDFALAAYPELAAKTENPRVELELKVDSHGQEGAPNLIYYNGRVTGLSTRNETRFTGFGGHDSVLLDPESTAAVAVFAMRRTAPGRGQLRVWLSSSIEEDEQIEARIGELVPGVTITRTTSADSGQLQLQTLQTQAPAACNCAPPIGQLPKAWTAGYPTGAELAAEARSRCPCEGDPVDDRLVRRVHCEYELFKVVEEAIELPAIKTFASIDAFTARALSVLNRRKSRAGTSLELHLTSIFNEEGVAYDDHKITENRNEPDFIFPSLAEYQVRAKNDPKLHMLAVKTTCKDRWRQILPEAEKIDAKHLFTLDTGISQNQFDQMTGSKVTLVVPKARIATFPPGMQPRLLSLEDFVRVVR